MKSKNVYLMFPPEYFDVSYIVHFRLTRIGSIIRAFFSSSRRLMRQSCWTSMPVTGACRSGALASDQIDVISRCTAST